MEKETERSGTRWDTSGLSSSYCNVANAVATHEAVVLNLGLSERRGGPRAEITTELLHRIALSPRTAKNLQQLLSRVIGEFDAQFGANR